MSLLPFCTWELTAGMGPSGSRSKRLCWNVHVQCREMKKHSGFLWSFPPSSMLTGAEQRPDLSHVDRRPAANVTKEVCIVHLQSFHSPMTLQSTYASPRFLVLCPTTVDTTVSRKCHSFLQSYNSTVEMMRMVMTRPGDVWSVHTSNTHTSTHTHTHTHSLHYGKHRGIWNHKEDRRQHLFMWPNISHPKTYSLLCLRCKKGIFTTRALLTACQYQALENAASATYSHPWLQHHYQ